MLEALPHWGGFPLPSRFGSLAGPGGSWRDKISKTQPPEHPVIGWP